jgi:hypothetical protein
LGLAPEHHFVTALQRPPLLAIRQSEFVVDTGSTGRDIALPLAWECTYTANFTGMWAACTLSSLIVAGGRRTSVAGGGLSPVITQQRARIFAVWIQIWRPEFCLCYSVAAIISLDMPVGGGLSQIMSWSTPFLGDSARQLFPPGNISDSEAFRVQTLGFTSKADSAGHLGTRAE